MKHTWDAAQCRHFARQAKAKVGPAVWDYISDAQREGVVAREIVSVLLANTSPDFEGIGDMIHGVMRASGVWTAPIKEQKEKG